MNCKKKAVASLQGAAENEPAQKRKNEDTKDTFKQGSLRAVRKASSDPKRHQRTKEVERPAGGVDKEEQKNITALMQVARLNERRGTVKELIRSSLVVQIKTWMKICWEVSVPKQEGGQGKQETCGTFDD